MSTPFMTELKIFSFNFAPRGWAQCNGQLLPINQNQALFSLMGTTYGGNGQTTFQLPDLRGRIPVHAGQSITLGERAGEEFHTVTPSEMPTHNHTFSASNVAVTATALNQTPGAAKTLAPAIASKQGGGTQAVNIYGSGTASAAMAANSTTSMGGSQSHENRQPIATLNICIALQGIFPSRN
jgi:microcystin-dependent protein